MLASAHPAHSSKKGSDRSKTAILTGHGAYVNSQRSPNCSEGSTLPRRPGVTNRERVLSQVLTAFAVLTMFLDKRPLVTPFHFFRWGPNEGALPPRNPTGSLVLYYSNPETVHNSINVYKQYCIFT